MGLDEIRGLKEDMHSPLGACAYLLINTLNYRYRKQDIATSYF
jgi:hypothetical protein